MAISYFSIWTYAYRHKLLDEKIDEASKLNHYHDKVYIVFFKCYWEDGQLIEALNKKNITEQDQELWSRIDEFSQFLNNKKIEMKSKNKKKRNNHKKRQKISKHERKRNPKHDLTPLTLKYSHGISYDEQKLLKYGHSLLKYADEKNTDEIRYYLLYTLDIYSFLCILI